MNDKNIAAETRPRRSALYMPGANERALEKARELNADCLLLDLEDAVAPDATASARDQVCAALCEGGYAPRELVVRINALDTTWGADDLQAMKDLPIAAMPAAILAPKISKVEQVVALSEALPDGVGLWIMVETPEAIFNIQALAACAQTTKLTTFVMGTNDLAKDMRAQFVPGRAPLMTALSMALMAARQYDVVALDGVFNDISDQDGLQAECQQGADMGFDGKTLIHPSQLPICHEIYGPSDADVEQAKAVVAAFAAPENAGQGVLKVNGKMTELLHRDIAVRTLAIADAIRAQGQA
jgi:citrate lyase subunit beta/citryl-CoA lyase